jgi:hypothetical protein
MNTLLNDLKYRRPATAFHALYQHIADTLRVTQGVTQDGVRVQSEGTLKAIAKKIVEPPYRGAR